MPGWLRNWLQRHQHPVSLVLHLIGIPLTIAMIPLAIVQWSEQRWNLWWRPPALLVAGYALQWLGHVIEGNDMGEVILVKKWLGKSYVAIAPRYQSDGGKDSSTIPPDLLPREASRRGAEPIDSRENRAAPAPRSTR